MHLPRFLASLAVVLACATACGGSSSDPTVPASAPPPTTNPAPPTAPPPVGTNTLVVGNNFFSPGGLTVAAGTAVAWNWNSCNPGDPGDGYGYSGGCVSHGIIFDDGVKSNVQSEGSFNRTFTAKGTYPYHCIVHGTAMSGVITVQ
jgi:plastocyanin